MVYPTASITTGEPIRIPLASISDALFHKETRLSDGEAYWELVYEIILQVNNSIIEFWVEINGQRFGQRVIT